MFSRSLVGSDWASERPTPPARAGGGRRPAQPNLKVRQASREESRLIRQWIVALALGQPGLGPKRIAGAARPAAPSSRNAGDPPPPASSKSATAASNAPLTATPLPRQPTRPHRPHHA